ncbi:class I SAM-dependent methyltransferase [Mongoliitalea daihaiensis]|nr:class I SAM-dependent methyltransferase [Mongoliitalea daihaiensis]
MLGWGTAFAQASVGDIVPYVTTSEAVMQAMFDLAEFQADDVLLDLGSGDGRIPIGAAKQFGIQALGVEIDPDLVTLADSLALEAGVSEQVRFVQGDLFAFDFNQATVLILYLFPDINEKLLPKIQAMPKGSRIISHQYPIGDWEPMKTIRVQSPEGKVHRLFYWVVE